ncbi:hypothetical protein RvY_15087-1 [Ramazzottius varieornatus]|uniref:Uncharacterized protein n=1 Tax=Ramazzottius varieornatus TaxID=947166 RepID=A0A1D1VTN5_RAMVA|nr:hypothetical protein RvY_15087-1 [Ramazzottius varieornatus]
MPIVSNRNEHKQTIHRTTLVENLVRIRPRKSDRTKIAQCNIRSPQKDICEYLTANAQPSHLMPHTKFWILYTYLYTVPCLLTGLEDGIL